MDYVYPALFRPEPDGGYVVTFPDVPEAITQGDDLGDAKASASEALGLALRGYLARGLPLPLPKFTPAHEPETELGGHIAVPVDAVDALKLAVIEAFIAAGISKSELGRRLGKGETEARRILDPDHPTKLAALQAALRLLGKQVVVSVRDAA